MTPKPPFLRRLASVIPLATPTLRGLAQDIPAGVRGQPAALVAAAGGRLSPEVARALPRTEGGQTPFQLQTDRLEMYDLFTTTIGESTLFVTTPVPIYVTLLLETAGPVVVSTRSEVVPVTTGKGFALQTLVPQRYLLPRAGRLYYGADAVNRVGVILEPVPWMEQIAGEIRAVGGVVGKVGNAIVGALTGRARPGKMD